jgi:transcriptional regulator with XRE-family HTH domain
MNNPKVFGKNLKKILCKLDMKQAELAERSKLTPAAISQIINGSRDPSLSTICSILNVIPIKFELLVKGGE